MKCIKCGNENSRNARFCRECGNKLEGIEQVTVGTPIPETSVPATSSSAPVPDHTGVQPTPTKGVHNKMVVGVVIGVVLLCVLGGGGYWYYQMGRPLIETSRDGHFISYTNGTVLDTKTNLMWAAKDNGSNVNWPNAKSYCENYRRGGYTDWRLPTQDELAGLYDVSKSRSGHIIHKINLPYAIHITELIDVSGWGLWASETRGSDAAIFYFTTGSRYWVNQSIDDGRFQALPVRSAK
jgi:hypothetical protein